MIAQELPDQRRMCVFVHIIGISYNTYTYTKINACLRMYLLAEYTHDDRDPAPRAQAHGIQSFLQHTHMCIYIYTYM